MSHDPQFFTTHVVSGGCVPAGLGVGRGLNLNQLSNLSLIWAKVDV